MPVWTDAPDFIRRIAGDVKIAFRIEGEAVWKTSAILRGQRQNPLWFIVGNEAASNAQRGAKADYYGLPCRRRRRHSVLEGV